MRAVTLRDLVLLGMIYALEVWISNINLAVMISIGNEVFCSRFTTVVLYWCHYQENYFGMLYIRLIKINNDKSSIQSSLSD